MKQSSPSSRLQWQSLFEHLDKQGTGLVNVNTFRYILQKCSNHSSVRECDKLLDASGAMYDENSVSYGAFISFLFGHDDLKKGFMPCETTPGRQIVQHATNGARTFVPAPSSAAVHLPPPCRMACPTQGPAPESGDGHRRPPSAPLRPTQAPARESGGAHRRPGSGGRQVRQRPPSGSRRPPSGRRESSDAAAVKPGLPDCTLGSRDLKAAADLELGRRERVDQLLKERARVVAELQLLQTDENNDEKVAKFEEERALFEKSISDLTNALQVANQNRQMAEDDKRRLEKEKKQIEEECQRKITMMAAENYRQMAEDDKRRLEEEKKQIEAECQRKITMMAAENYTQMVQFQLFLNDHVANQNRQMAEDDKRQFKEEKKQVEEACQHKITMMAAENYTQMVQKRQIDAVQLSELEAKLKEEKKQIEEACQRQITMMAAENYTQMVQKRQIDAEQLSQLEAEARKKDAAWANKYKNLKEAHDILEKKLLEISSSTMVGKRQIEAELQRTNEMWATRLSEQEEAARRLIADQEEELKKFRKNTDPKSAEQLGEHSPQHRTSFVSKEHLNFLEAEARKKDAVWANKYKNLKEAHDVLEKRVLEIPNEIRAEMKQNQRLKEMHSMYLEDLRSRVTILLEELHQKIEELQTLRNYWPKVNEVIAGQCEKFEKQAPDDLVVIKKAYTEKMMASSLIHELKAEWERRKQQFQSTHFEEHQRMERLAMTGEDYLARAWKGFTQRIDESTDLQCSRIVLDQILIRIARREELSKWKAIDVRAGLLQEALDHNGDLMAKKERFIEILKKDLKDTQDALAAKQDEVQHLKLHSLQPSSPSGNPLVNRQDVKNLMQNFLKKLLDGMKTSLVLEGGGKLPCTLYISKDLSTLEVRFQRGPQSPSERYHIPTAEIQHVIAGKETLQNVRISTPVDEETITIIFGPSQSEQHTCCIREASIEERNTFVNGMKVLGLARLGGQV